MTPQLQYIKDRLSKIESDTAEARKMLEKVETADFSGMVAELEKAKNAIGSVVPAMSAALKRMVEKVETEQKAGPWRPQYLEKFYYTFHDGLKWTVGSTHFFSTNKTICESLISEGNTFRTEAEALEVATQRQFITEYISAGDLAPTEKNAHTVWIDSDVELDYLCSRFPTLERKFSTRELLNAFIEKWGGEKAVAERLSKGWR